MSARSLLLILKNAVDGLKKEYGEVPQTRITTTNVHCCLLCKTIEDILTHQLLDNPLSEALTASLSNALQNSGSATAFAAYTRKKSGKKVGSSFWKYVSNLDECLPNTSYVIENISGRTLNNRARGRMFIRFALNESSLHDFLCALAWNRDLTAKYYKETSLMMSDDYLDEFLSLLNDLNHFQFTLSLQEPNLDSPSYWDAILPMATRFEKRNSDLRVSKMNSEEMKYPSAVSSVGVKKKRKKTALKRKKSQVSSISEMTTTNGNLREKEISKIEEAVNGEDDIDTNSNHEPNSPNSVSLTDSSSSADEDDNAENDDNSIDDSDTSHDASPYDSPDTSHPRTTSNHSLAAEGRQLDSSGVGSEVGNNSDSGGYSLSLVSPGSPPVNSIGVSLHNTKRGSLDDKILKRKQRIKQIQMELARLQGKEIKEEDLCFMHTNNNQHQPSTTTDSFLPTTPTTNLANELKSSPYGVSSPKTTSPRQTSPNDLPRNSPEDTTTHNNHNPQTPPNDFLRDSPDDTGHNRNDGSPPTENMASQRPHSFTQPSPIPPSRTSIPSYSSRSLSPSSSSPVDKKRQLTRKPPAHYPPAMRAEQTAEPQNIYDHDGYVLMEPFPHFAPKKPKKKTKNSHKKTQIQPPQSRNCLQRHHHQQQQQP